jgi:hypothetical protein
MPRPPYLQVPIVQRTGQALRPVWTDAKNLSNTGIRSSDRLALSELLHQLRYPGPHTNANIDTTTTTTTTTTNNNNTNLTVEIQLRWNVYTEVMPGII